MVYDYVTIAAKIDKRSVLRKAELFDSKTQPCVNIVATPRQTIFSNLYRYLSFTDHSIFPDKQK